MNKTKRVIFNAVVVLIALVGVLNLVDSIYASIAVSAGTSNLTMSATINPSSTITVSGNGTVSLDIAPSASGTFASNSATIGIYTNTSNACTVTMDTTSTSLTSSTDTPIATLSSEASESSFTNDRWGYRVNTTGNYKPVAASDNYITTLESNTGSTPNTATNVYFAAKLTPATKPGTYTTTVTFASTCTGGGVASSYMQDQDASTLASLMPNVGDETTLIDSRDNKSYTVAKLADGNYWMTQNLDHDIVTTAGYYTPENTDIPAAWTPSTATYTTDTTTWNGSYTAPESYDPGDLCWDGTINEDWDGTLDNETTTCGSDKHMHIGNYYNWTAAVAMNDSSSYTTRNADVNQSICPAGWRLPIGGTTNTGSKSFQYLWNQYSSSFDENTMMNSPLYFSYAGAWYGYSDYVGSYGYYWSSVVYSSYGAYELYFETDSGVYPQDVYDRLYGLSVRCVAR